MNLLDEINEELRHAGEANGESVSTAESPEQDENFGEVCDNIENMNIDENEEAMKDDKKDGE